MIARIVFHSILLLPILAYSKNLDFDIASVERIILSVTMQENSPHGKNYYCINKKDDISAFVTSFSKVKQPAEVAIVYDISVTFKTKDKEHKYVIFKEHILLDSLLSHYLDLAINEPNWFQFKIVSDRFDLFDTTLNYLKENYVVDDKYRNDKIILTSHRIRFQTKDFIKERDKHKFVNIVDSINKKFSCVFCGDIGGTGHRRYYDKGPEIIPRVDIYFPCRDVHNLIGVIKYLDSFKWIVIEEIKIKNDFEIMFWVERVDLSDKYFLDTATRTIKKKMNDNNIPFRTLQAIL
jgi:hypothetical protein